MFFKILFFYNSSAVPWKQTLNLTQDFSAMGKRILSVTFYVLGAVIKFSAKKRFGNTIFESFGLFSSNKIEVSWKPSIKVTHFLRWIYTGLRLTFGSVKSVFNERKFKTENFWFLNFSRISLKHKLKMTHMWHLLQFAVSFFFIRCSRKKIKTQSFSEFLLLGKSFSHLGFN